MTKKTNNYFYAIRKGKRGPVITQTWLDASDLVQGFSGAQYKGFPCFQEAVEYIQRGHDGHPTFHFMIGLNDAPDDGQRRRRSSKEGYYYVTRVPTPTGDVVKVHTRWGDAEAEFKGVSGAIHKAFSTREKADEFAEAERLDTELAAMSI